ncbi:P-type conjugative transfer protein VirB9 (plasmid) [Brevundimonas staleyi]|uniref:P-type conjugative transfer protein VirB9 n=1 Tax=Brevundimonas staleyi TaxID=74326 RepID=A0ABW0FMB5_9CAUL
MRRASFILALVVALAATPVLAEERPQAGSADRRMREVDYDPAQVYRVVGVFRIATQIVLAPDEAILHVAVGDSVAWEVAAEGNVLFVKPRGRHQPTNLIITTSRGGETRHYAFELVARQSRTEEAAFQIRFRYPDDERARAAAALDAGIAALDERLVALQLERGAIEGVRNLRYSVQGDSALQPSEVTDNGRFTVLRFPANQAVPTIFTVTPDGTESLVPFDVRGEFVVIHATGREFRLRRGRAVLCIYNEAFDAYGVNLGTGTAASDVDRTNREARP